MSAEPILLATMRRHPEAEVRVEWDDRRMGTTARGFVAEYDDAVSAARAEVLAEVEALAEKFTISGHPACLRINCTNCTRNDFAHHLRALVAELGGVS